MKKLIQQQGDVLLYAVAQLPKGLKPKAPRAGRIILADGEVTGHAHAIADLDDCELFEDEGGTLFLSVKKPVALRHEEHKEQTVQPGLYEVGIVKEYDHLEEEARQVRD